MEVEQLVTNTAVRLLKLRGSPTNPGPNANARESCEVAIAPWSS
jgi:hypothetical protein